MGTVDAGELQPAGGKMSSYGEPTRGTMTHQAASRRAVGLGRQHIQRQRHSEMAPQNKQKWLLKTDKTPSPKAKVSE